VCSQIWYGFHLRWSFNSEEFALTRWWLCSTAFLLETDLLFETFYPIGLLVEENILLVEGISLLFQQIILTGKIVGKLSDFSIELFQVIEDPCDLGSNSPVLLPARRSSRECLPCAGRHCWSFQRTALFSFYRNVFVIYLLDGVLSLFNSKLQIVVRRQLQLTLTVN